MIPKALPEESNTSNPRLKMYTKRKLVFYCEFCKKYKLTSFAMKVHEKHCTLNPTRICRMPGCRNGNCPICEFSMARLDKFRNGEWDERSLRDEVETWRKRFYDAHEYA